jgi:ribosomal protein S21
MRAITSAGPPGGNGRISRVARPVWDHTAEEASTPTSVMIASATGKQIRRCDCIRCSPKLRCRQRQVWLRSVPLNVDPLNGRLLTRPLPHARTSRPYPQIDNCRPRRTTRFERNAPTGAQTSLEREGIFREMRLMRLRKHYEKPSKKKVREKAEAIRRVARGCSARVTSR